MRRSVVMLVSVLVLQGLSESAHAHSGVAKLRPLIAAWQKDVDTDGKATKLDKCADLNRNGHDS